MGIEAGHLNISEFSKETIPMINYMLEDLFCQYGVNMPYFLLDFDFPDYSQRPDWVIYSPPEWYQSEWKAQWPTFPTQWPDWLPLSGFNFNLDWGKWGYTLPQLNELMGFLFDEAHLPREMLPDFSLPSWDFFNDWISQLYENIQQHYVYDQSGTFTKDEVIEGETSGITGYYKWKDSDGYLHICNKSAADFEDEKITGQTSGAYAWTYEEHWRWTTYSRVTGHNRFSRAGRGADGTDYSAAQSDYTSDPSYYKDESVIDSILDWRSVYYPIADGDYYYIAGMQTYLSFNTSAISAVKTAYFNVFVKTSEFHIDGTEVNPTLYIYKQDWTDPYDSGDWYGGTLIAQREFTEADKGKTIKIEINPTDVTIGDVSKYRFTLKGMHSPGFWPDPKTDDEYSAIRNRMGFTTIRLKVEHK